MNLKELKDLRRRKKVSIKELSRRIGVNRDRISLIERGKVNPSFETVASIVAALGAELSLIEA